MMYSKFFEQALREERLKKLDHWQMLRVFRILAIEASINTLQLQKGKIKNDEKKHYYDEDIWSYQSQLATPSGNLAPEKLLEEMLRLSQ